MILNHKHAIELLVDQADEIGFNCYTVLNLHALLAEDLLADPRSAGRLRSIAVGIGGTVFHPLDAPDVIEDCFNRLLASASAIRDPFEQAFFVMVHLPYLHPFEDVNKRTSRLAANIPLIKLNLSPLSFVDVPPVDYIEGMIGVYELNRVELLRDVFVWAYQRSCARYATVRHALGDPDPYRQRHRQTLIELVTAVVHGGMDKRAATAFIASQVARMPENVERPRLITLAETELSSLHEGNFARFRLRPAEYYAWKQTWR
jgi:fido (protein-threonine AMPylation protein)